MTRYTQLVKGQPIETPVAAMDSRETLIQQQCVAALDRVLVLSGRVVGRKELETAAHLEAAADSSSTGGGSMVAAAHLDAAAAQECEAADEATAAAAQE